MVNTPVSILEINRKVSDITVKDPTKAQDEPVTII